MFYTFNLNGTFIIYLRKNLLSSSKQAFNKCK